MRRMGIAAIYRKPRRASRGGIGTTGLPVSAQGSGDRETQPRLGGRHHLRPDGQGIPLPCGDHGLEESRALAWRTSNTLTTDFCLEALNETLAKFGAPEIFNPTRARSSTRTTSPRSWSHRASASAWTAR